MKLKIVDNKYSGSRKERCNMCKRRNTCSDFLKHSYPVACFQYEEEEKK